MLPAQIMLQLHKEAKDYKNSLQNFGMVFSSIAISDEERKL